jgi:hypothetical protein
MKHAIFLILKFILLHFLLLLIVCVVYYFTLQSTQVVAGESLAFLPVSAMFPALPFMIACVSLAAGFWVQGSCVRTSAKFIPQCASGLVVLAAWLAVIPACALFERRAFPDGQGVAMQERISAGYFRIMGEGVFFSAAGGKTTDGVFLLANSHDAPSAVNGVPAGMLQTPPYSDSLVAQTIETPSFLLLLTREALFFADVGKRAWGNGWANWLCFASICLPLAALSALTRSGTWKLKTIALMVFAAAAVVSANRLYLTFDIFGSALSSAPDIPHVALNAILTVIIVLAGVFGTVAASKTGDAE